MSIYISDSLYLSELADESTRNRPLIGYHSVLGLSDLSASTSSSTGPASNLWSPDTYTYWRTPEFTGSGQVTAYINMEHDTAEAVDYITIVRHNFGTEEVAYTIQYSHDNSAWEDATEERVPADDRAILEYFGSINAPYWRIRMIGDAGGGGTRFRIAHVRLGRILRLQRPMYVGMSPFTLDKAVRGIASQSDNGNYLGAIITSQWYNWSIEQQNNDPDFVRDEIMPFIDHLNHLGTVGKGPKGAFTGAWRPDDYPHEVLYGWKDPGQNVTPANQRSNGMMQWSCSGKGVM